MEAWAEQLEERLGYAFADLALLVTALTHASVSDEETPSNERLEFLGDAVIDHVMCEHLFRSMPEADEGEMTVIKSAVVSGKSLAGAGQTLGLAAYLHVDGGLRTRNAYSPGMIGGAYEAVVGAIFLDGGIGAAGEFVLRTLGPALERIRAKEHRPNYKSILQQRAQTGGKRAPTYDIVDREGPGHRLRFQAVARIGGEDGGAGWGNTKKEAEQHAAHDALNSLYPGWEKP